MLLFAFLVPFVCCAHAQDVSQALEQVRALKERIHVLEQTLANAAMNAQEGDAALPDQGMPPAGMLQEEPEQPMGFGSTEEEQNRLKEIEEALVDNPLGTTQRRMLKQFLTQVKNDAVKAEAHYFLGEVYYLRQKLVGGKKKDNQKALNCFSRSYSLDPHSNRTPKTLVRLAQCLAKDAKYTEAQSILDKVKAEYGKDLGFDLEQEYKKVLDVCTKVGSV